MSHKWDTGRFGLERVVWLYGSTTTLGPVAQFRATRRVSRFCSHPVGTHTCFASTPTLGQHYRALIGERDDGVDE